MAKEKYASEHRTLDTVDICNFSFNRPHPKDRGRYCFQFVSPHLDGGGIQGPGRGGGGPRSRWGGSGVKVEVGGPRLRSRWGGPRSR